MHLLGRNGKFGADRTRVQRRNFFLYISCRPVKPADERRLVILHFDGPDEVTVSLVVTARVRSPLTLQPDSINLGVLSKGHTTEKSVQVENYSEKHWSGIEVVDLPNWLTFKNHTQ